MAQPSISAFFKRKSPPLVSPTIKSPSVKQETTHNKVIDIVDDDDDDILEVSGPSSSKKPRTSARSKGAAARRAALTQPTSSYFNQASPKASEIKAQKHDEAPVAGPSRLPDNAKRSTALDAFRLPPVHRPQPAASGSAFGNYSLAPVSQAVQSLQERVRTEEQDRRHEAWQYRLMAPGGLVPRRRSLALDEAAASEARRLAGGDDVDPVGSGEHTPLPEPEPEDAAALNSEDESRKTEAESVGNKLAAKFAAKGSDVQNGKGRKKKKEEDVGPSGQTYTPLEKQYMEIKDANPDVLLFMEVGYKYKFHGDDAKTASKELGIACFPQRNFYTASIPTHRMNIHVKKLISLGYKVGVVSQTETAALKKASENRNAPFTRKLTHLFTAATYVEDPSLPSASTAADGPVMPGSAVPPTNALVAIVERGAGGQAVDERVSIGIVSVVPETGDVVWDEFDDSQIRSELETRLTHLQPAELLLPTEGLSRATEKVLKHFAGHTKTSTTSKVRIERFDSVDTYEVALSYLTKFYSKKAAHRKRKKSAVQEPVTGEIDMTKDDDDPVTSGVPSTAGEEEGSIGLAAGLPSHKAVLALVDFPEQVVVALSIAVRYMKTFGLENAFRYRSSFVRFINRAHMLLSSNTLNNLEIYQNQTDGGVYGSLLWLLGHTKTRMGRRLLREWIGRPLLDVEALQARVDAIEEISTSVNYLIEKLRSLLVNMPDLVKGLTRIHYGKATPTEVATILIALNRIGSEFKQDVGAPFKSALLNNIVAVLPTIRETAQSFLGDINVREARENNEADLWQNADKYPDVQDAKDCILVCDSELHQHLHEIRQTTKRMSLNYVTVAGIEYLIEVPTRDAKAMPAKWAKIQSTKSVVRFHTPEVLRITRERDQHKETLAASARQALLSFQADISENHSLLVVARQVAVIDCLMSMTQVAATSNYCKPSFTQTPGLHIRQGRHPMVEVLRDDQYVPFDIDFSEDDGTAKVITGPNMAGKSSCVRATALIVCMAQIGSFVPADSVKIGIHDAVQTRMGASDEIGRGKSTFMVELSETSDILRTITPRTLVILDELGRGTSTYDGVAIAYATLSHLAKVGCNVLFVTHYPMVAEELAKEFPQQVSNWHMSFDEIKLPDGSAEITFLYKLTRGLAEASFGVWCARLAGLPRTVLQKAQQRADDLKLETEDRLEGALMRRTSTLLKDLMARSKTEEAMRNALLLHKTLSLVVR